LPFNASFIYLLTIVKKLKMAVLAMINIIEMATLTTKNLFVGYSTVGAPKGQQLVDLKLVEQDLLNHFYTRRNERVMMPGWGCGIWDYLFEPLNVVRNDVIYEAQKVIDADPRVQLQSIDVSEKDHGLRIEMVLLYVPLNAIKTFAVDFDRRSLAQSGSM
jgi:phage baseplate assembly protein W